MNLFRKHYFSVLGLISFVFSCLKDDDCSNNFLKILNEYLPSCMRNVVIVNIVQYSLKNPVCYCILLERGKKRERLPFTVNTWICRYSNGGVIS